MPTMKCFVDTSALAALYNKIDMHHQEAREIWSNLRSLNASLYTTRDVISETITLVRRRVGFQQALTCGNDLWESPVLDLVPPAKNQDLFAWEFFKKYSDKELSFVDCLSFTVMKELRIHHAFTFDKNFTQVGFETLHP